MKSLGNHLGSEMVVLLGIESAMVFGACSILMSGGAAARPGGLGGAAAGAALAVTACLIAAVLGLYRRAVLVDARVLAIRAVLAATLAVPCLWAVGTVAGVDLGAPGGSMGVTRLVAGWSVMLFATRLLFRQALCDDPIRHGAIGHGALAMAGGVEASPRRLTGARDAGAAEWQAITGALFREKALPLGQRSGRAELTSSAEALAYVGDRDSPSQRSRLLRRAFDLIVASALLLITLPLMLLTAALIRIDSAGPVFYRQERVGLNNQVFTLFKFRSMRVDAEANGPVWAAQRDARVTQVGGFIRRVRIDELPQLINIFRGEMSIVGPRPERPHFVAQLAETIPGYDVRARVKPGITGWAQVNYPYGASIEDARAKLSYDLFYVRHRSLWLDTMILLATVRVVLFQEGAR